MKRILALLLALLMLIPSTAVVSLAAGGSLSVSASSSSVKTGDSFTVSVGIGSNPGIVALKISVSYPSCLELVSVSNTGLLSGYVTPQSMKSPQSLYWSAGTATENNTANGTVATLTFKGKSIGSGSIQVSLSESYNQALSSVSFSGGSTNIAVTCSHSGTMTHHAKVAANCVDTGTIEYWSCSACQKNFSDSAGTKAVTNLTISVDSSNHKSTRNVAKKDATCKEAGYTAGVYCDACKKYVSGHETIPVSTTHTYGNTYTKVNDTQHKRTCTVCGNVETTNHTWDNGKVTKAATCKETGTMTYTCTLCSANKTETIQKSTTHTYGNTYTKVNDTQHKRTCTVCGNVETSNHTWDNGKVTKAATCKETGTMTYTCTLCSANKTETIQKTTTHTYGNTYTNVNDTQHKRTCTVCGNVETSNHTWDNGKVTKEPTCKDTGIKTYNCTLCSASKNETVSVTTTHTYGDWTKVNDTTHKRVCSVCSKEETANHSFDSGKVTKSPTCKEAGERTYTCNYCGCAKTEVIAKTDTHSYGDYTKKDDTSHVRTCKVCGKAETAAHTFDSGTVTKQPTCKDTGTKTYQCTVCGAKKTETVPKTDTHRFDEGKVTKNPTDKETGTKVFTCQVCGLQKTEVIPVTTHTHTFDSGKITIAATCKDAGVKTYTCTSCGNTKTETVPKLTAHTFDSGKVTKEATCKSEGEKTITCLVCGETKTEKIAKLSHTLGAPETDGSKNHKRVCSVCGEEVKEAHKFDGGRLIEEATAEKEAEYLYTCTVCGETKTVKGEKAPATETDETTAAVETELPNSIEGEDGVKIASEAKLPEGTVIVVKAVEDEKITGAELSRGFEAKYTYDISLDCAGVEIQPDGKVAVTLPLPTELLAEGNLAVFHIADDGTATLMESRREGDSIVFVTDHFSYYTLAAGPETEETTAEDTTEAEITTEAEVTTAAEVTTEGKKDEKPAEKKPNTLLIIVIIAAVAVLAGAGVGVFFFLRKKKKEK